MDNLDPYDNPINFFDEDEEIMSYYHQPNDIEITYHELIHLFQGMVKLQGTNRNPIYWSRINRAVQLLTPHDPDFNSFQIHPENGHNGPYVNIDDVKVTLSALLGKISQKFGYGDPSYAIYHNLPGGQSVSAVAHSSPHQEIQGSGNSNNTLTQEQTNQIILNTHVNILEQAINSELDDEQQKVIRPVFEEYKKDPGNKPKIRKLLEALINAGSDISIAVLTNLLLAGAASAKSHLGL